MTLIKFCGMTRAGDVAAAIDIGVNAVGFVLWPSSPRHIDLRRVAEIVAMIPPAVTPVGVFVRPSADDIARAIDAGIQTAQIHGSQAAPDGPWSTVRGRHTTTCGSAGNDLRSTRHTQCAIWMAASLTGDDIEPMVSDELTVLLDAHDPERHGGTGRTIEWTRAARVAARRRVMLAGGLTPANVGDAVRAVRPYGVDVASGIEDTPGVKNAQAMQAFVAAVREADQ